MNHTKPMPLATAISTPFWQSLKDGVVRIQQCQDCQGWVFYPRNHCSHCLSDQLEWKEVTGEATLYSFTIARVPTMAEFAGNKPQVLAVVQLKEGVQINTTIVGVEEADLTIGMSLKPVFEEVDAEGTTLLQFTAKEADFDKITYQSPFECLSKNDRGQVQIGVDNTVAISALPSLGFTPWSNQITVDQTLINDFAKLSGDDYWLHTDPERAEKESPFGSTIAHGALVQVLQSRFDLALPYEITGFSTMMNYGSDRLRFPAPVPVDSVLHARARVKSATQSPKGTQLTLEVMTHVVGNERPSVINELVIIYR
ncbi:OB-fold domain-containing protein [Vibrio alfacsensis]|uniref:OB-fold domain-containing protein n=1 Tax=Vibrio alfacsensis TaxID=1074311 RepID=UPI004067F142